MRLRTILQITAGLVFFGIIAGYSAYQAQDFWTGPTVTINTPADGATTSEPLIRVTGAAERISHLSLNGRQIYTSPNGRFSEPLLLAPGYNIITVAANDAFDRHTEEQVRVILHATSSLLFSSQNYVQEERRQEENEGTEE